jgi:hypothetical protein
MRLYRELIMDQVSSYHVLEMENKKENEVMKMEKKDEEEEEVLNLEKKM